MPKLTITPPLHIAQMAVVTQNGDTFFTPPIPWSRNTINSYEYWGSFPGGIPTNIIYRSGDDVILVTSIAIDEDNNIVNATEVNLTTGTVSIAAKPQDYRIDETLTADIDGAVV